MADSSTKPPPQVWQTIESWDSRTLVVVKRLHKKEDPSEAIRNCEDEKIQEALKVSPFTN